MGSLIDIAEIAGLLFAAYMAGWLAGYWLHRVTARAPMPEAVPAHRVAAPEGDAGSEDPLVRAPVVVPVSAAAPPPHVVATATQIEPVRAVAIPGNGVLAEAEPIAVVEAPPSPQISAIETLKALSTAIPLVPVEAAIEERSLAPAEYVVAPPDMIEAEAMPEPVSAEPVPEPEELDLVGELEPPMAEAALAPAEPETGQMEMFPAPAAPPPLVDAARAPTVATADVGSGSAPAVAEVVPAPVAPAPEPQPVPTPPVPPAPASAPGLAWAGALKGQEAQKFKPVARPTASTRKPATVAAATVTLAAAPAGAGDPVAPVVIAEETATPIAQLAKETIAGLDVALLATIAAELKLERPPVTEAPAKLLEPVRTPQAAPAAQPAPPAIESAPEPPAPAAAAPPPSAPPSPVVPVPTEPEPALVPPPEQPMPVPVSFDEGAAMRAIEGGWSRRAARALPDSPEMTDVSAAVSAAQVAVEQVLARNGVNTAEPETRAQAAFGKPVGLPQPRDGRRDNLKRIDGLGPLDESTLNNLGIYHYDQIAKWDEREVLWLENHVFAVGRIGRESWQDQARELIADREATRALR